MNDMAETHYRYTACGLDNVFLVGLPLAEDRGGDQTITIPSINKLHAVLRRAVAQKDGGLDPKEIRFLRSELELTQAELARVVHKDAQTIGRWERGETQIDGNSETLLRAMALEQDEGQPPSVRELSAKSVPTATPHLYNISVSNEGEYSLAGDLQAA